MSLLSRARADFHLSLVSQILTVGSSGIPSNADGGNRVSIAIAKTILDLLGGGRSEVRPPGQTTGSTFEVAVAQFLRVTFQSLEVVRPGHWTVEHVGSGKQVMSRFGQFRHLAEVEEALKAIPALKTAIGSDYFIKPDVIVARAPEPDEFFNQKEEVVDEHSRLLSSLRLISGASPILHASVSCKWSLRSDRAQNSRSEALNLIKNRKGPLPHVVVVTGEPLPSRIASLALGTGELDMVYHFALPELVKAAEPFPDASDLLEIMIKGNRLRDIADLPLDLAV